MSLIDELKLILRDRLMVTSEQIDAILAHPHIADALALKAAVDNEQPDHTGQDETDFAEGFRLGHNELLARLSAIKAAQ